VLKIEKYVLYLIAERILLQKVILAGGLAVRLCVLSLIVLSPLPNVLRRVIRLKYRCRR
jgi:hypothetical protein